jgi:hypothetical protein
MFILPILKLGLIGFVFWGGAGRNIGVTLWGKKGCVGFGVAEIGFVLHKTGRFVEEALQV